MQDTIPHSAFLDAWHQAMIYGAIVMCLVAVLIFIIYQVRLSAIRDYKEKHDFINTNEIKWYKYVFYAFGVAVAMIVNIYAMGKVNEIGVWFFVRFFIGIAALTLVGYVAALVLEYYYPTALNRKLRKWRYMPRVNPATGNKMRLLREDEEDIHLNEGMQAEENVFSIDYDVWIDEKTKDIKIEKYQGHLIALQCKNCGFYTMRVVREEIVLTNEDGTPKELVKHYQCTYCKNVRATQFRISRKESDDFANQKPSFARNTKNVEMVKVEIVSSLRGRQSFEFQTVEEAQKFLDEFDADKVA
ncbi:MAG: hypothetical protein WDO14_23350 [Bacteroidota bacterium]